MRITDVKVGKPCDKAPADGTIGYGSCNESIVIDSMGVVAQLHARPDQQIINLEKDVSEAHIEVHVYTGNMNAGDDNNRLSQNQVIRNNTRLNDKGFDSAKITPIGHGEHDPIADNETEEGKAQNRRVDFLVQYPGVL